MAHLPKVSMCQPLSNGTWGDKRHVSIQFEDPCDAITDLDNCQAFLPLVDCMALVVIVTMGETG